MKGRTALWTAAAALMMVSTGGTFASASELRIGLILPMTGPFTSAGARSSSAVKLYSRTATVAGPGRS
jgi:hypothetical protein